jgi:transposase-like protein
MNAHLSAPENATAAANDAGTRTLGHGRWDTRVGSIALRAPRVRDGSYFPSLLEPRRRAERALVAVVQEA